jgi:hypothetical protein
MLVSVSLQIQGERRETADALYSGWKPSMIRTKISVVFPLVLVLLLPSLHVSQVLGGSIFSDGFESGDFSAWTGNYASGATISATPGSAHQGTYKATIAGLQYASNYAFVYKTLPSTYVDLYARAYVEIDSKPSTSNWYDMGIDIDGNGYGIGYSLISKPIFNPNTNKWGIRVFTGGTYVSYYESGTSTVNAGEWYCVEQRTYVNSTGFVTLWVDGILKLNQTEFSTNEHGTAAYAFAGFRWVESDLASSLTEYVDDFVVDTSYIGPEPTGLPNITILSPGNTTYTVHDVPLTFTVNETASWMGYSLDKQANVTIADNTTLTGLLDGSYQMVVYANDTFGNMGSSGTVYFTVDTVPPSISVLSPKNTTYNKSNVELTFTVNESASWMGYSLDGQGNVTVGGNTTLTGLADGSHRVVVYANDTFGNMGGSGLVYFTVDTTPPSISVLSPINATYTTSDVPLIFTVNETASWMGYSLDGQSNVTIGGNTTLTGLADRTHNISVYANDTFGNMGGSNIAYFTVETTKHDIAIAGVTEAPSTVSRGYGCSISLSITDIGNFTETFNVTVYANMAGTSNQTTIATFLNVTLNSGNSTMLAFMWDTSGFAPETYTISAYATPVSGETNVADNTFVDGTLQIIQGMSGSGGGGGRMPYMD